MTVLSFAILFLLTLLMFPHLASAQSQFNLSKCPIPQIEDIYQPLEQLKYDSSKPSTNNLVVWKAHTQLAEKVWQMFERGELQKREFNIDACIKKPVNDNDLMLATNNIFLQKTFERLNKINPQMYLELNQKIDFNQIVFQTFAYCEACQMNSKKILGEKSAGYNLTTQALFMNIQTLSPEDWDVIFIHELGHHFDQTRKDSKNYFNLENIKMILNLQKKFDNGESLSTAELQQVDQWIMSGLNVGLLAEWRVWAFTLKYLDGVSGQYNFGQQTQWLKKYRDMNTDQRDVELFRMLDSRFKNSNDQLLSHQLVQQRLNLIRTQIRNDIVNHKLNSELLK